MSSSSRERGDSRVEKIKLRANRVHPFTVVREKDLQGQHVLLHKGGVRRLVYVFCLIFSAPEPPTGCLSRKEGKEEK